ncbi:hypothetical protein H257_04834 [Aphanomyces astaci]|uniref:Uncharacterized protein n=1 Tax=Aphanomyces astaci TaxID=112090 RepID=W4GUY7_APHAT|nr:hypothetical protein H257_04834 [Aphanomyces astaci]ETV83106.1 hypothetical protein H257_04834 [Aphanomyces astaci]|eukprot:XP_009827777.1 hypothetical protein H257_04834 [Aphanomyces astaci]
MCRKIDCSVCHKPTWAGCGQHIDSALANVAVADRCPSWQTGKHDAAVTTAAAPSKAN